MRVSNLKPGQYIGFGGELYTLWSVGQPDSSTGMQNAIYLGNISKDLSEAQKLHPGAILSDLKGDAWAAPSGETRPVSPFNCFQFGKYAGSKFSECDDVSYMVWYYSETSNGECRQAMIEMGIPEHDGRFFESMHAYNTFMEGHRVSNMLAEGTHEVKILSNFAIDGDCVHPYSMKFAYDNEAHSSRFAWGQKLYFTADAVKDLEIVIKSYQGFEYGTLKGKRSMKGIAAQITTNNFDITKIEFI